MFTKTTAVQNEVALSYHKVHGLYFLAVVFATSIAIADWRYIIETIESGQLVTDSLVIEIIQANLQSDACKWVDNCTSPKNNCRAKWSRA